MTDIEIRTLTRDVLPEITDLQRLYAEVYPGAVVIPGEVYLSPGADGGRFVFCALDGGGRLLAYAPVFPVMPESSASQVPVLWTEVKALPGLSDAAAVKNLLLEQVSALAHRLAGQSGSPQLTFSYFPNELEAIDYVLAKGARRSGSIYQMARDLSLPLPEVPAPDGVTIRAWRMETEAEQAAYVAAHNEAFPKAPIRLEEWQYFMQSPQWAVGTAIAAFDGSQVASSQVAGSVAVFWDEGENQALEKKHGYTEYIFVRPAWRGRGIARALVRQALLHLKASQLDEARLEVRAENDQALGLYLGLGYRVTNESRLYLLDV